MTQRVAVTKMHGARNDFIVLDARVHPLDDLPGFARRFCDRHSGIGADQVLVVGASESATASMRVFNPDGSEAEMCGNGVRCVARYLDENGEGGEAVIETIAGPISTAIVERGDVYRVRADVSVPRFTNRPIPLEDAVEVVVGNPHLVLFRSSFDDVDLASLGEAFQRSDLFPEGINVHVAVVENRRELRVRHYERGAGLTMACGTGSVGCVAAGIARGVLESPVTVHVPGGELLIEIDDAGRAFMTGPAERVFEAAIDDRTCVLRS